MYTSIRNYAVALLLALQADPLLAYSLLGSAGAEYITINEMNLEHYQYEVHRNPYFADAEVQPDWRHHTRFNFQLGITDYIFWDNKLHMDFDGATTAIRHAGWEYTVGFRLTDWLDILRYHHSQHVLEDKFDTRFPNTDAYGVRITFLPGSGRRSSK
jgi:hypothetical protein